MPKTDTQLLLKAMDAPQFVLNIDDLLPMIQGQDIKISRALSVPRCLSYLFSCSHSKGLRSYKIEITSEAALQSLIERIKDLRSENDVTTLGFPINPPITHLHLKTKVQSETLLLLLAHLTSIKELTIESNQNISISRILLNHNIFKININEPLLYLDKEEKGRITKQMNNKFIYLKGSRYRFNYASPQTLRMMWVMIFFITIFQLYKNVTSLSSIKINRDNPDNTDNTGDTTPYSLLIQLIASDPLIWSAFCLFIWVMRYDFEKYRSRQREIIRSQKIDKHS